MEVLKKKYIVDSNNKRIAVQIPIDTFKQIEELLENYGLVQLMKTNEDQPLTLEEAKTYYDSLDKAK